MATHILISSYVVTGSSTADVTFSSIPSTYTDLRAMVSMRSTNGSQWVELELTCNGDTSTKYGRNYINSTYSAWATGKDSPDASTSAMIGYHFGASSGSSNLWGNYEIYFPSYANSSYKKVISSYGSIKDTATNTGFWVCYSASYNSTSAISSIKLKPSAGNWAVGSSFYLYGISNA